MTPTPPPPARTQAGFVVLDLDLPDRAPLAEATDYDTGLLMLAAIQEKFYDQLDANAEGATRIRLGLTLAPRDAAQHIGPPCYWAIVNGVRPATARGPAEQCADPGHTT